MDATNEHALKIAEFLLSIKAVELNPQHPFTWASGLKSPIYCDNRKTLSYPDIRSSLREHFSGQIRAKYPDAEVIAGVATGGIALGALVAQELNLPFVYVRSEAKKHGLNNQVEGHLLPGQQVVVIEDLISTGKSSLNAVNALRQSGAEVKGMLAIFTYGFEKAAENFRLAKCEISTLTHLDALLNQAAKSGYIREAQKEILLNWKSSPEAWSEQFQSNSIQENQ